MTKIPENALIVVADGEGARLFRNQGTPTSISLHQFDLIELTSFADVRERLHCILYEMQRFAGRNCSISFSQPLNETSEILLVLGTSVS